MKNILSLILFGLLLSFVGCTSSVDYEETRTKLMDEYKESTMAHMLTARNVMPEMSINGIPEEPAFNNEIDKVTHDYAHYKITLGDYVDYIQRHNMVVTEYGLTGAWHTKTHLGDKKYTHAIVYVPLNPNGAVSRVEGPNGFDGFYPYINLNGIPFDEAIAPVILYARFAKTIWMSNQMNSAPIMSARLHRESAAIEAAILENYFYVENMPSIAAELARKDSKQNFRIAGFVQAMPQQMKNFFYDQIKRIGSGKMQFSDLTPAFEAKFSEEVRLAVVKEYVEENFPRNYWEIRKYSLDNRLANESEIQQEINWKPYGRPPVLGGFSSCLQKRHSYNYYHETFRINQEWGEGLLW